MECVSKAETIHVRATSFKNKTLFYYQKFIFVQFIGIKCVGIFTIKLILPQLFVINL